MLVGHGDGARTRSRGDVRASAGATRRGGGGEGGAVRASTGRTVTVSEAAAA